MRNSFMRGGKRRMAQQGINNDVVCICPQCGYSQPHTGGNPCRSNTCPLCRIRLMRGTVLQAQEIRDKKSAEITIDKDTLFKEPIQAESKKHKVTNEFPQVTAAVCTGCGTCVDACRLDAISLQNGVAVIDTTKCVNCRLCERLCPSKAIS